MKLAKRVTLALIILVLIATAIVSRSMDLDFEVGVSEEFPTVEVSPTYVVPTPEPTPEVVEEPEPVSEYAGIEVVSSESLELIAQQNAPERPWMYDDDLPVEDNVYSFLIEEAGLNKAAACGVWTNIKCESNFKPTVDSGISYGLCQWLGTRLTNLKTWCEENGYDYSTAEGQLRFLVWELKYDDPYGTWDHLCEVEDSADGAYSAAHYFCYWFERPLNASARARYRGFEAIGYYDELG